MTTGLPPTDPEQREEWRRDPALYTTMTWLVETYEQLVDALHDRLNETGLLLRGTRPDAERLEAARESVKAADAEWQAALASADALLRERQEGGG
jgi:hypothetical protein